MKKRIISNVVLARLLVSSSGLHAQESMFERKMKDAGQALQSLNQAFQTATSNFINQVTISPEIWRKLKAGAAALAAAIIAAAASYFVYKITSAGKSSMPVGSTHQERFSVEAMKKRYPAIGKGSWDITLLNQVESIPLQGEFGLGATLAELKNEPAGAVSNAAYNAVLEWATSNNKLEIKQEVMRLMAKPQ